MTSEWRTLENLHLLLKPFAQYTSLVSGQEYTTISSIIPIVMEINLHLEEMKKFPELTAVSTRLQSELKQRFKRYTDPVASNHEPVFLVSTLLNPQFKLLLNPTQTNSAKTKLLRLLKDANGESSRSSSPASPMHEADEHPNKRFCHLSKVLEQRFKEDRNKAATAPPGEELEQHLQSVHEMEAHFEPWNFWVGKEKNYPLLSSIVKTFLQFLVLLLQ